MSVRLGLAGAVALTLLLTGCGQVARSYPVPPESLRWSQEAEMAFLSNCEKSSTGNYDYCNCTLNYVESNESPEQVEADAMYYLRTGVLPAGLLAAARYCLGRSS